VMAVIGVENRVTLPENVPTMIKVRCSLDIYSSNKPMMVYKVNLDSSVFLLRFMSVRMG
jgi:hypothetical protein